MRSLLFITTLGLITSCTLAPPTARDHQSATVNVEPAEVVTVVNETQTPVVESGPSFMMSNQADVILNVQKQLRQKGYNPGQFDGVVGPHTSTALIRFQRNHGLVVTGQINEATLRALNIMPARDDESVSEVFAE